ncbi:MAG: hypothetical protein PHF37_02990 [Phycisphaerae bacterium]|nr:hypothetical protein [Phycisphaerae bacterium]
MRFVILLSAVSLLVFSGCDGACTQKSKHIDQLKIKNSEFKYELETCQKQNTQLADQVEVLSTLDSNKRLEGLYDLENVHIGAFSNLYDKDEDGKIESLIVYVQPIDNTGDSIKAAGQVDIQLWDLNKSPNEALLGEWNVSATELKKLWVSLFSNNYRLVFNIAGKIANYDSPLTVKVVFTDYLSGKVFREQKTIEPKM